MFSGGKERDQWHEMGQVIRHQQSRDFVQSDSGMIAY